MTGFGSKTCALLLGAALSVPIGASAQQISESFENVGALANEGWVFVDNSTPLGFPGWFQGLTLANAFFDARTAPSNAYIASAFSSVDVFDTNAQVFTVSNWLLTPEVPLVNGAVFEFFSRTIESPAGFPDRLQVFLSTSGASTDVGSDEQSVGTFNFSNGPLIEVNERLTPNGYPEEWTHFSVTLSGVPEPASGRFGFRHYVTDALNNGDYIGVDDVTYLVAPMQVPEPSGLGLLLVGTLGLAGIARRSSLPR